MLHVRIDASLTSLSDVGQVRIDTWRTSPPPPAQVALIGCNGHAEALRSAHKGWRTWRTSAVPTSLPWPKGSDDYMCARSSPQCRRGLEALKVRALRVAPLDLQCVLAVSCN